MITQRDIIDGIIKREGGYSNRAADKELRPAKPSAAAAIVCLRRERRPSAVARLVIAVIVDAVKRQALRASAHVRQKCRIALQPASADANASAAVVCVFRRVWIRASLYRVSPCSILFCSLAAGCIAMRATQRADRLGSKASAARCLSAAQRFCSHAERSSAVASAAPPRSAIRDGCLLLNLQAAESLTCEI
jgi:hypothetical protein